MNPQICQGKPHINSTEIKVSVILDHLAEGVTFEEIVKGYPPLTLEDIKAAVAYAAQLASKAEIQTNSQPLLSDKSVIEETFTALVNQWRAENRGVSSTNQMCMHPAYQQIIGMGEVVIPLLLKELEKKSGRWFWALKSISREDPVPEEYKGNTKEMTKAWLDWGKKRGYQW